MPDRWSCQSCYSSSSHTFNWFHDTHTHTKPVCAVTQATLRALHTMWWSEVRLRAGRAPRAPDPHSSLTAALQLMCTEPLIPSYVFLCSSLSEIWWPNAVCHLHELSLIWHTMDRFDKDWLTLERVRLPGPPQTLLISGSVLHALNIRTHQREAKLIKKFQS